MFTIAILIGIYSYLIFSLGLLGLFYKSHIVLLTIIFFSISIRFNRENLSRMSLRYFNALKKLPQTIKGELFLGFLITLLALQAGINLIGALGPELGFDALWYHLTIPKIYLMNHSASYIPGGLLYYSVMPKLTEMLYVVGLAFGDEIFAKMIHFTFGILCLIALYKLSRKFLSKTYSLLTIVLFYSNLVVGWMSITAYVDLARTFFEFMALWGFIEWFERRDRKWFILSAVMLGLAISTKLLALGSLLILSLLIVIFTRKITNVLTYCFCVLLIPFPWFVFSYIHAGNPVHPFFSNIYSVQLDFNLVNPLNLSDPISPLYIVFLPIGLFSFVKLKVTLKIVLLYSLFAIIVWYLTPQTGGGRFILPYLPAFSLIMVIVISMVKKIELRYIFVTLIIVFGLFSIFYRGAANIKYIPVILGKESKSQFLSNHLNFSYGDFYDIDGYFNKKIKANDKVLLYGFHNLYYVNFPFIDSSFVKKGDLFNYIAVLGNNLPERFKFWNLIYYNQKTSVKLYSLGGIKWTY